MSAVEETASTLQLPGFGSLVARREAVAPRASAALVGRQQWERRYRRLLRASDAVVVMLSCATASVFSLLATAPNLLADDSWILARVPLATAAVWLAMLSFFNTREAAIMGAGAAEYKRVAHATGFAFGVLAMVFVLFEWVGVRTQLYAALPAGFVALLWSRWMWRRWLCHQRAIGRYASRTVVVGSRDDVEYVLHTFGHDGRLGYQVVGTTVLDEPVSEVIVDGHAYLATNGARAASRTAIDLHADTIVVASQPAGDPTFVKRLAWQLEGTAAEVVLSSRIADVAGPRMSLRPVEGMPLIHVRIPRFDGGAYIIKRVLDVAVASLALIAFAPFALIIVAAILMDDGGPVFFRQARVGRDGREFGMVKFRSMSVDAERQLAALSAANDGSGPLFKLKNDPRVTRVGRVLRRYSLDEIPQFWNVLRGEMSVVGPRPPLPNEVTRYDGVVFRRLYIKPGITGPWQVGGRSDLSWEESVRLDLRYVENWSVMGDLQLMWRTARVMVKPEGAY